MKKSQVVPGKQSKVLRNQPYLFFISSFTVSVTPLISTHECSSDFMILIKSSITFLALKAAFRLIFLSNLFIAFEAILRINLGQSSPSKEISTFFSVNYLNYLSKNQKIQQIELF